MLIPHCTDNISDGSGGIETEAISGIIVDVAGLKVEGASVVASLLGKDKLGEDSIVKSDTTLTDIDGEYRFTSMAEGTYNFEASKEIDSILYSAFINSRVKGPSALFVGEDTLKAPGFIAGNVQKGTISNLGIDIYIPGTSYSAHSDSAGNFIMSGVPVGDYTVAFDEPGYIIQLQEVEINNPGDTGWVDSVLLIPDPENGIIAPELLELKYDTAAGKITLIWKAINDSLLAGYLVYKKDSSQSAVDPELISGKSLITDTLFEDKIDGGLLMKATYIYQLKSQDLNNNKSSYYSNPISVTVYPDLIDTTDTLDNDTTDTTSSNNNPPDKANSPKPINNSLDQDTALLISWSASDQDGDTLNFSIFMGLDDNTLTSIKEDCKDTFFAVSALKPDTAYFWRVDVSDQDTTIKGDLWKFKTGEIAFPVVMININGGTFKDVDNYTAGVSDFMIQETEVTLAQYQEYDSKWINASGQNNKNDPVGGLTFPDVIRFCNWLSNEEGLDSCYTHDSTKSVYRSSGDTTYWDLDVTKNGYRLPSSDEWQYAAKGGLDVDYATVDGSKTDVNESLSVLWTFVNSGGLDEGAELKPVKHYEPNGYNLYDMSGNVSEFCWDHAAIFPNPRADFFVDAKDVNSAWDYLRGGDNLHINNIVKITKRLRSDEVLKPARGFRLCRSVELVN